MTDHSELPMSLPDSKWKRAFRRNLNTWYQQHKRDLPWRKSKDPYHIWISEIMLQQTQVATVIPYFHRFIATFPTVEKLANAKEETVLHAWEGLGYYRRARNLHAAAKQIVNEHGGAFPDKFEDVLALAGIGRYTAGAILSIAHDQRLPILEANTIRLYSRLLGYEDDPRSTLGTKLLWAAAEDWLPRKQVGDFNQALMELGSVICTPTSPKCLECPVKKSCAAFQQNKQDVIPLATKKIKIEAVREASVIIQQNDTFLVIRNDEKSRWAGMWDFPRFPISAKSKKAIHQEITDRIVKDYGLELPSLAHLTTIKHSVTRYRITLEAFLTQPTQTKLSVDLDNIEHQWATVEDLQQFPLSVTGRKLFMLISRS